MEAANSISTEAEEPPGRIPLRFCWTEFSGSLGDLGTFLPLALGLSVACGLDFGAILIFAGLMNAASGWLFRQPIAVQPMKAIAAAAIAEGLGAGEVAAAGLCVGLATITLTAVGAIDWIDRVVPRPVVRGIQAGVGIKLALAGCAWIAALPPTGWNSWSVAAAAAVGMALLTRLRLPAALLVFPAGFALLYAMDPGVYRGLVLAPPQLLLLLPSPNDWWIGLTRGALPQLPLTLLNSVIAVCALSADHFPGRGIAPRRMAASVGLMNLLCVPFGAMPMCHGAGGLAAQLRFGARTGGSVIILGALKLCAGLAFGASLIGPLRAYPEAILGVMVIAAGATLASAARDSLRGTALPVVAVTTAVIVVQHTLAGFLAGITAAALLRAIQHLRDGSR